MVFSPDSLIRATNFETEERKMELLKLINQYRAEHERHPLRLSQTLSEVAKLQTEDQGLAMGRLSQTGSDSTSVGERVKRYGVRYLYATENVIAGQDTPTEAHCSFIRSPLHARNILSPEVGEVGFYKALAKDGRIYWTEVVCRRKDPTREIGMLEAWKEELFSLLNQHRAENGRPPLRLSKALSHIAKLHTKQQARMGRCSLKGSGALTIEERLKAHNIKCQHLLSTDAEGQGSPAELHRELVESLDTCESLLSLDVDEVGIHVCKGKRNRHYWTEVLCRGLIDPALHPGLVERWMIELLDLINEFRCEHARAPLRLSSTLSGVAKLHNEDQALRIGDCSHEGSDGCSLEERLERRNIKYCTVMQMRMLP